MTGEPPGFPEFLAILRRSRTLLAGALILSLLIGGVVALTLPARYTAVAILLPPDDRGLPPLTRAERESLALDPGGPGPLEVLETPAGQAARLLQSKPVIDLALTLLQPAAGWNGDAARIAARGNLVAGLHAAVTDEKIILVRMESGSADWAARAANAMGEALDRYNVQRRRAQAAALAAALQTEIAATEREMAPLAGKGAEEAPGLLVLQGKLVALGDGLGRARKQEVDPTPSIEFLERAEVPARPSAPIRPAIVALFLFAGFLGGTAGAYIKESMRSRGAG